MANQETQGNIPKETPVVTGEQFTNQGDSAAGSGATTAAPDALDLVQRLKVIAAELETGVGAPGDLMTPSEKLRAIADLIDRREGTSGPSTERSPVSAPAVGPVVAAGAGSPLDQVAAQDAVPAGKPIAGQGGPG